MLLTSWIFTRWIAIVYLIAFWSLGLQILGLVGSHGILPSADYLHYVSQQAGPKGYWLSPTLCWLNQSDGFLLFLCWGGALLSILLLLGIWPAVTAFLLWLFYLSLTTVGQDFLGFQWDNLLLETGFLAVFLFPRPFAVHFKPSAAPSRIVIWLLRWLLFRLMFGSGMVKLLSGDKNWIDLNALTYHYWTQPLPNVISWYAAQLPLGLQKLSCLTVFVVEVIIPFFIFFGRWPRLIAFFGIVGFQVLIILTGNYCFFNLLAIGLCLILLEDEHYAFFKISLSKPIQQGGKFYKIITGIVAALIMIISLSLMGVSLGHLPLSKPIEKLITLAEPLRSVNNYGLFAVMTTQRNEIIFEGSNDGEHWLPYVFPFKPGDVYQAPRWATPYQPRLDWQMWFAALGPWQDNQWVFSVMLRLLQGEPAVLHLFANNPFKEHPPKYIQATFWEYHFTNFKTKGQTGAWWHREIKGLYCPTASLR